MTPAEERAIALLEAIVTPEEFQQWMNSRCIIIRQNGDEQYKLDAYRADFYRRGDHLASMCIVFENQYPSIDALIMRYLLVKGDPKRFWQTADVTTRAGFQIPYR
jgi:hypothetical protein